MKRRRRLRWKWLGLRERLAFVLAPWLRHVGEAWRDAERMVDVYRLENRRLRGLR